MEHALQLENAKRVPQRQEKTKGYVTLTPVADA
jgi:hypothetical protein